MRVCEVFLKEKVTKAMVEARDGASSYWSNTVEFLLKHWDFEVDDLSHRQVHRARKALDDLHEWRIEKKMRK